MRQGDSSVEGGHLQIDSSQFEQDSIRILSKNEESGVSAACHIVLLEAMSFPWIVLGYSARHCRRPAAIQNAYKQCRPTLRQESCRTLPSIPQTSSCYTRRLPNDGMLHTLLDRPRSSFISSFCSVPKRKRRCHRVDSPDCELSSVSRSSAAILALASGDSVACKHRTIPSSIGNINVGLGESTRNRCLCCREPFSSGILLYILTTSRAFLFARIPLPSQPLVRSSRLPCRSQSLPFAFPLRPYISSHGQQLNSIGNSTSYPARSAPSLWFRLDEYVGRSICRIRIRVWTTPSSVWNALIPTRCVNALHFSNRTNSSRSSSGMGQRQQWSRVQDRLRHGTPSLDES